MQIAELVWDDWNEDHVARHGIQPEEVEEAVFDQATLFFRTKGGRYLALGLTEGGRYLLAVLDPAGPDRAYVVTARDMTDAEKRRFKSRGK